MSSGADEAALEISKCKLCSKPGAVQRALIFLAPAEISRSFLGGDIMFSSKRFEHFRLGAAGCFSSRPWSSFIGVISNGLLAMLLELST
jgi:hypothetical protein